MIFKYDPNSKFEQNLCYFFCVLLDVWTFLHWIVVTPAVKVLWYGAVGIPHTNFYSI